MSKKSKKKSITWEKKLIEGLIARNDVAAMGQNMIKCLISRKQKSFVAVDLETTGFSYQTEKVIEVAGIKIKNNKIVDTFQSLIHADYIPYYLTKNVHGIDVLMVKDAPPLHLVRSKFCKFIKGHVLVGHNIKNFDSKFLDKHFGLNKDTQYIDTLDMSRILFSNERCHTLEAVSKRLGIKGGIRHRAFDDAKATAEIFLKFLKLNLMGTVPFYVKKRTVLF